MSTCKDCIHTDVCRLPFNTSETKVEFADVCRLFKNKADFVEVKHGRWERVKKLNVAVNPYQHTCGICGKSYFDHNESNYPHCPFCGADMDGQKENEV